jgi:hypothetical protein
MLSKCLNPACSTPFRYLRDGRIYQLEIPAPPGSTSSYRRREFFWLCGQCCSTLTVVVREGVGCVQPRYLELPSGDLAEESEPETSYPA